MSTPSRFAKRKAIGPTRRHTGLAPAQSLEQSALEEKPRSDPLASAIDQILEGRARDRVSNRLRESKMVLLRTVAIPFGLGHIVATYDRVGGDVHTINNVRNGVYATEEKKQEYDERGEYKTVEKACHDTDSYNTVKQQAKQAYETDQLDDSYTGQVLSPEKSGVDIDHTIASSTVFNDRGRVLSKTDTAELSTKPQNLNATHPSINRSKKDATAEKFIERLEQNAPIRKARIAELEAKQNLTDGERKELTSRKALDSVDTQKLREVHAEAQVAIDSQINWDWYASMEFAGELIGSAATSTAKAGLMAAFGEFLVEFLAASYDEAHDWYLNGTGGKPAFEDLKVRLERVAGRVMARKDAAWKAFKAGSLTGFIASLISVIINAFKTTQKRVRRMLQEGVQSLVRVISLIARPSDSMSMRESLYAATHVVTATGIMVGGIALEESLEDAIKIKLPVLAFVAEPVAVVLSGVVTGLTVVLTASLLDRWDPYGVIEEQDLRQSIAVLRSEVGAVWGSSSAVSQSDG